MEFNVPIEGLPVMMMRMIVPSPCVITKVQTLLKILGAYAWFTHSRIETTGGGKYVLQIFIFFRRSSFFAENFYKKVRPKILAGDGLFYALLI